MFRFLFTRRWLGLLLAVLVIGTACVELGLWQFRRYAERHDANDRVGANLRAAPVPLDQVMSRNAPPDVDEEWRVVTATGRYDVENQIAVLYRTRDGAPGVDVVAPLRTSSGSAVLVDRGWVATTGNGNDVGALPKPPPGTVTVTGWVRRNADPGSETTPNGSTVRAISSDAVQAVVPYPLYDGFLDLTGEKPVVHPRPATTPPPDLGSGPHFFYGLQWFFFALLALGFWCYFAWTEYRQQPRDSLPPARSQRPDAASVDRQHRAGDVAGRR